ncbi:unnamed protein product [Trichobilharzia szidati]|nr:unnamed protein product [Trichobilharzia szidati]
MSCYDSEACGDDNHNFRPSVCSRSSRESPVQNGNLDTERNIGTSLSSNLFWRSRSQPPFGETVNHMNAACGPSFLNTESNQQVSAIGPTDSVHTLGSSHYTTGTGLSSSARSVGLSNSNRISMTGNSRISHQRRIPRTNRFTQNRDNVPGLLSSSSSNSSLVGRYRTISGVNSRPQSIDPSTCESHLSRLLRFGSLRFDETITDVTETSTRRQDSPLGDYSNDEFPELPVRLGSGPCNFRSAASSSANASPSVTSNAPSTPNNTSESQEQTQCNSPITPTHVSSILPSSSIITNSDCNTEHCTGSVTQVSCSVTTTDIPSSETTSVFVPSTPKQCSVKFPKRGELDSQRGSIGSSSNYQPEADHDFYQNDCFSSKVSNQSSDYVYRMYAKLNELRCQGLFCDVVLQAGTTKIHAHRNVLAASSQYFHAMFTSPMTESRSPCVHFHGIEGSALTQLINFIYTNEISVNEENVQTLLPAANLLQLTAVRDICCEFLQSQLHPSNCLGIQKFADLHNCQNLLDFSRRFTEQHFGELLEQDDEFLKLDSDQLVELISSDRLAVSEDQVFEAVLRWIAHNPNERQSEAQKLCSHVRFAFLPRDYLACLSRSDAFLTANPWCKDYLIEALSYHLLPWDRKLRMASERTKPRIPDRLPKILLVVGGQAPKAIRSVECFEFQEGSLNSLQTSNRSDPVLASPSTSSHSVSMESMSLAVRSVNFNDSGSNSDAAIISDLPSRRCRAGVAVVDGLIYVIGGFNGTLRVRSVEVFDRIRNTWHSGPNMEFRRATLGVAVLNGLIYAVGGFDGIVGLNSAEVLDVWSGSWRSIPSMACQRSSVGVGAVDGKVYAVGGFDGTVRRCLSTVECYDPTTNAWCMVSEMAFRRSGPAVCALNNRLYAVGGHDGPVVQVSAEVYSPETGVWQRIADLNVKRRNAGLVAHDGFLYVIGGEDGENDLTSIEKYDPATNTWALLPTNLRVGRSYAGVIIMERNAI